MRTPAVRRSIEVATSLSRKLGELNAIAGGEGEPRVHWLVTGFLVSGAMWAVLIAVIVAVFGQWVIAGCLLGLAVLLVVLLLLAFRRTKRIDRES
jgi:Flp pilus assembly protein TadB